MRSQSARRNLDRLVRLDLLRPPPVVQIFLMAGVAILAMGGVVIFAVPTPKPRSKSLHLAVLGDPYRGGGEIADHRKQATCSWCRHYSSRYGEMCTSRDCIADWPPPEERRADWTPIVDVTHFPCSLINMDGNCSYFEPSWLTRMLRFFKLGRAERWLYGEPKI